jgi:ribosomal protein L37AE/L43A
VLTQAKEKVQAHALEGVLAILGTAIPAWLLLAESRIVPFVARLDPATVVRALAASLVVALWSVALLLYFRPKLRFEPRLGIYRDRKSGLYFCPSCHSKKLRAPLREEKAAWRCMVKECDSYYRNPDYKEPPAPERKST